MLTAQPHPPVLHFHPSEDIRRGGVLIKTRFGILDASRENKLEMIEQGLLS
jgi:flagellar biosynthesis/type III secretory pathway protein FliH